MINFGLNKFVFYCINYKHFYSIEVEVDHVGQVGNYHCLIHLKHLHTTTINIFQEERQAYVCRRFKHPKKCPSSKNQQKVQIYPWKHRLTTQNNKKWHTCSIPWAQTTIKITWKRIRYRNHNCYSREFMTYIKHYMMEYYLLKYYEGVEPFQRKDIMLELHFWKWWCKWQLIIKFWNLKKHKLAHHFQPAC
jgi:hypothetical protein